MGRGSGLEGWGGWEMSVCVCGGGDTGCDEAVDLICSPAPSSSPSSSVTPCPPHPFLICPVFTSRFPQLHQQECVVSLPH